MIIIRVVNGFPMATSAVVNAQVTALDEYTSFFVAQEHELEEDGFLQAET